MGSLVYSLVNVPTVVRDLARHPHADGLADVLLRVLALTDAHLAGLDALGHDPREGARRREILAATVEQERALPALAVTRAVAVDHGLAAYAGSLADPEAATLGSLDDLIRFVRHEALAAAWSAPGDLSVARHPVALEIVTDALVAVWSGSRDLGGPWRAWTGRHPDVVAAPVSNDVAHLVARLSPAAAPVVPADWAERMHDACWAVHLTGRERLAAAGQLHALRALLRVTAPVAPRHGLVATVVAAAHAAAVADVLDGDTHAALARPLAALAASSR